MERLLVCTQGDHAEYQRYHHIQGYGLHCPQAEIFSRHKIHRTIIQIKWELTSEYTDTHVADVLTLDPGLSDAEKAKLVNDRIAEIAP